MTDINVAEILDELLNDETLDPDLINREIIIATVTNLFSTY